MEINKNVLNNTYIIQIFLIIKGFVPYLEVVKKW